MWPIKRRGPPRAEAGEPAPLHIRNAPTKLMKEIGYGAGYAYDHDAEDGFSGQDYFPEGMENARSSTCHQSAGLSAS